MAFIKSVTTSQGVTADYWILSSYKKVKARRELVALFHLYRNQESARSGQDPLRENVAKLTLTPAQYDKYLGTQAGDRDMVEQQIYVAARELGVVSDYGSPRPSDTAFRDLFLDAADA